MGDFIDRLETIAVRQHELAELVRAHCHAQKEFWQQIPWLALQADGRTGFSDERNRQYRWGLYALESGKLNGNYRYFVELESGDLVKNPEELDLLTNEEVLRLAVADLDAQALIGTHLRSAQLPDSLDGWRAEIAEQYGLAEDKPYERRKAIRVSYALDSYTL